MGMLSRRKGRKYEQQVARILREQWPGIEVHRSMQSEKALNSDVYITNAPAKLERLWLECQDSRKPTPTVKLEQAERDIAGIYTLASPNGPAQRRLPVVVWHRIGERVSFVTTRLYVLDQLRSLPLNDNLLRNEPVTMELGAFLDVLSGGVK